MENHKVAVIVAGSWGTALASVLADNGCSVALWTRNVAQADEINNHRCNGKFMPGVVLSERIEATTDIAAAVKDSQAVLIVAPSKSMRSIARQLQPHLEPDVLLIHATKGFEAETLKRMSEVIAEETGRSRSRIVVLSGPSHAEEVIRRSPTTVVVAAEEGGCAEAAQALFINSNFRVYTNPDVIGVEVAGALKNIIALGAGMSDGLGFGDNAKAALVTRGLAEIARLGTSMGANPLTFAGLAGVGDLVVTCTSRHSRNWRAGYSLAQGRTLDEVLQEMGMVVEGVRTTLAAYTLSGQYEVEMPITAALHEVLFEGGDAKSAVDQLMGRGRTCEIEELAQASLEKWLY